VQTFLPYRDFVPSVETLDDKRLGKQRVEAFQILRALTDSTYGWQHHPAVNMWRGYEEALALYGLAACLTWVQRGNRDNMLTRFFPYVGVPGTFSYPEWLGDDEFHRSHQSNLVRKDAQHYGPQFPDVPDDLPYYWPTQQGYDS
jgi:hypothetical protein